MTDNNIILPPQSRTEPPVPPHIREATNEPFAHLGLGPLSSAELQQRNNAAATGLAVSRVALKGMNESTPTSPEDRDRRRRERIFKPLDVYKTKETVSDDWFDLFLNATDEEMAERGKQYLADMQNRQREKFWPVTEKTTDAAVNTLERVRINGSINIGSVLNEFSLKGVIDVNDPRSAVDAIRTNAEVRLAVGNLLLDRVNNMASQLPTRVWENGGKSLTRNATGVTDLKSREVVALMALAKLDGTFDEDSVRSTDRPDHGRTGGQDSQGQHGQAANIILGLPIY